MSTYQTLKGLKIKYLTTDTSGDRIKEGELFYNSIAGKLKSYLAAGAWHSGANLILARRGVTGAGTQTAGLASGGGTPNPATVATEEYNGSGWVVGGDLNTGATFAAAAGTQTAGLKFGGATPQNVEYAQTEEYNGTSWTESGDLSQARQDLGGCGTQTAALAFAGSEYVPETNNFAVTEEYNGSSWTSGGDMNSARRGMAQSGTQTAALSAGGNEPTVSLTEEYNGTSWSESGDLSTARVGLAGAGIQTASLAFGGSTSGSSGDKTTATEGYDGTSWSSRPSLGTARRLGGGAGLDTAAIYHGGYSTTDISLTEEFTVSLSATTGAAWSSGANYPTDIQDAAGAGPTTAAVLWGGYDGPAYDAETFEYDGTSWTESGDLNTARACYHVGAGSQTAALQASGYATTDHTANSEEYNGTAWTEGNNLNNPRYSATGGGIQTSALICGGNGDPGNSASAFNESYNGTSWSNETAMPGTKAGGKQYSGTGETASLIIGFGSSKNDTLSYDGSSWTDLGHHLVEGKTTAAGGSQQGTTTAALIAGGYDPSPAIIAKSQQYNGTVWVTAASLATARRGGGASGTAASCLAVGGERPAQSNAVEEFTGETTAARAAKTIDFD